MWKAAPERDMLGSILNTVTQEIAPLTANESNGNSAGLQADSLFKHINT